MAARASRASAQRQILKYALLRARARSANNATWKLWGLARQPPAIRMMHSIGWLASHPRDDENGGRFCGCAARAPQRASRVDIEVCRVVRGPPGEAQTRGNDLLVRARCARQRATELLSAGAVRRPARRSKARCWCCAGRRSRAGRTRKHAMDCRLRAAARRPAKTNSRQDPGAARAGKNEDERDFWLRSARERGAGRRRSWCGALGALRPAPRKGSDYSTEEGAQRGAQREKNTKLFQVWHAPRARAMTRWCRLLPRHHMPP